MKFDRQATRSWGVRTWSHLGLRPLGALIAFGAVGCSSFAPEPQDIVQRARDIHSRVLTIDTHDDIPFDFATPEVDPGVEDRRQVDLPKMREGLLDAAFFVVYVGQTRRTPENIRKAKEDALIKFDAIHRMTQEMYPKQIGLACTPDQLTAIHESGRLAAAIGIENGFVIGKDLALLAEYRRRCASYMTLAHVGDNDIADSSIPRSDLGDDPTDAGLSEFGRRVVEEMNRLGIMVDISHVSPRSMFEATRLSRTPVIASHSAVRAICDHPRNLSDEQLVALKENGGVVQIVALDAFVKKPATEKTQAIEDLRQSMELTDRRARRQASPEKREEYQRRLAELDSRWPPAKVSDFVDHIDYAVKLIGIEHVGISSDFDGGGGVDGWRDASETFNVTLELVKRGYTEDQIALLWGGNLLRVWRAAVETAESE